MGRSKVIGLVQEIPASASWYDSSLLKPISRVLADSGLDPEIQVAKEGLSMYTLGVFETQLRDLHLRARCCDEHRRGGKTVWVMERDIKTGDEMAAFMVEMDTKVRHPFHCLALTSAPIARIVAELRKVEVKEMPLLGPGSVLRLFFEVEGENENTTATFTKYEVLRQTPIPKVEDYEAHSPQNTAVKSHLDDYPR